MNLPRVLLALVVVIALLLGAAALVPAGPGDGPGPHERFGTLLVGGAGAERPALLVLGWAFGSAQIAFFAACFALGLRRPEGLGPIARPLVLGALVYEALWTALVLSYARHAGDVEVPLVGGLPEPSAWMIYGLWPFPLVFAWLYLRHFDGWVLTDADLEHFRTRLDERRAALDRAAGAEDAEPGEV